MFALVVASLAAPSAAAAAGLPGTYVTSSCSLGDQPIPLIGWYRQPPSPRHLINSCGQLGGRFAAHWAGQVSWDNGEGYHWLWNAPTDTVIAGLRLWGEASNAMAGSGGVGAGLSAGRDSIRFPSGGSSTEDLDLNATQLSLGVGCGPYEGCLVHDHSGGVASVTRLEILLRDIIPPATVSKPTGSLLSGQPLSGTVQVGTAFRDRGGGVRSLALFVGGKPVAQKVIATATCRQPSPAAVPCPLSGRLDLSFNTRTIADGPYRAELELRDIAGNRTLIGPYQVVVANAPPQAAPPKPGRLALNRYSMRVKYGARAALEGTLTGFDDSPIAGAAIEVAVRPRMRASQFVPLAPIVTDANGRFAVPIGPGPSREVRLRYASSETSAMIETPAPIRLRVTPTRTRNGGVVRFSGSIPGTDAGTRVELQARAGRRWVPFRSPALAKGKFRARYRFVNTNATQRYRFRAVVKSDPNFPYGRGTSRIVSVLVRR